MKKYMARYFLLIFCVALTLAACGPLGYTYHGGKKISRGRFIDDQQIYQPYRDQNTLEAYREFLRNHPKNLFTAQARDEISILEFKPYEKQNTVEGYLEFKMLYPRNPNVEKANWHIEQVEIKRYDSLDTIAGYREFIEKYPDSIFVNSAHERLQELSFRENDRTLRKKYGFDLLKYRYEIHKAGASYDPLWNFQLFAYTGTKSGKPVFINRLLYSSLPNLQEEIIRKKLKDTVVSGLLGMIANQGNRAVSLPRPSFEICHAPGGINANAVPKLIYDVPHNGLRQLVAGRKQPNELLTVSQAMPVPAVSSDSQALTAHRTDRAPQHIAAGTPGLSPPAVAAGQTANLPTGAKEIMQLVSNSNMYTDAVLSRHWETNFANERKKELSVIEKHISFDAHKSIRSARVLRYLSTQDTRDEKKKCATAILVQYSQKGKERYWYIMHRGDPGRTPNIATYRPDAENDFFLEQYVDPPFESETHTLVAITTHRNRPAAIIKSSPKEKNPYYAWRTSTIDRERMVPLMIEYYDEQGELKKNVAFTWAQRFGIWYWDTARFENLENGSTTRIKTTDIRINIGLHERDFQPGALSRLTGR